MKLSLVRTATGTTKLNTERYEMILNDTQIHQLAKQGMISPYESKQVRLKDAPSALSGAPQWGKVISYGLSSFGYDCRLDDEFQLFRPTVAGGVIDPKNIDEDTMDYCQRESVLIPPNAYILGSSLEYFKIPPNVMCIVLGKSTYARCGIIVNVTPLEPGWEGNITIEISNASSLPAKIYANEGIAQIIFFKGDIPAINYGDKKGKYQGQKGVTVAKT